MERTLEPIDLAGVTKVYFDTSAWNYVSKHGDRALIVRTVKHSGTVVLASVISVGEILRTPEETLRRSMCSTIRELHGAGHLLEGPQDMAVSAAKAVRKGEKDWLLPRSGPGNTLDRCMRGLTSPPVEKIRAWLDNMDNNLSRFIDKMKPDTPDTTTRYCSPEVILRDDFLQTLCEFPASKELRASVFEVREMCQHCDIWMALAATWAYIIELSTAHTPKSQGGKSRTSGPDVWQLAYLGVADIFVTNDTNQLEAACRVSQCLKFPRCVAPVKGFVRGIVDLARSPGGTQGRRPRRCQICGCRLAARVGMHATPLAP
jgi:hypothetical protein